MYTRKHLYTSICSKHEQYHDIHLTDVIGIYWEILLILKSIEVVFCTVKQFHFGQYGQSIQIVLLLTTTI